MLAQTELPLPDEGSGEEETGAQLQALPDCVLISERHQQKPFVGLCHLSCWEEVVATKFSDKE